MLLKIFLILFAWHLVWKLAFRKRRFFSQKTYRRHYDLLLPLVVVSRKSLILVGIWVSHSSLGKSLKPSIHLLLITSRKNLVVGSKRTRALLVGWPLLSQFSIICQTIWCTVFLCWRVYVRILMLSFIVSYGARVMVLEKLILLTRSLSANQNVRVVLELLLLLLLILAIWWSSTGVSWRIQMHNGLVLCFT